MPPRIPSTKTAPLVARRTGCQTLRDSICVIDRLHPVCQIVSIEQRRVALVHLAYAFISLLQITLLIITPSLIYLLVRVTKERQRIDQGLHRLRQTSGRDGLACSRTAYESVRSLRNCDHALDRVILYTLGSNVT